MLKIEDVHTHERERERKKKEGTETELHRDTEQLKSQQIGDKGTSEASGQGEFIPELRLAQRLPAKERCPGRISFLCTLQFFSGLCVSM